MKFNNLLRSAGEDVTAIVTGFPFVSTFSAFLTSAGARIIPMFKFMLPSSYLDWRLEDWRSIYCSEDPILMVYGGENVALPQVLYFDNTEERFSLSRINLILDEKPFLLDPGIKARTEDAFRAYKRFIKFRGKSYSNEPNLRLRKIVARSDALDMVVQKVDYEDYIRTNLCLDSTFRGKGLTLRSQIHADGRLEPLEESPLANNFGINILLFTADGQVVVQERSKKVIVRPGEYCPSASGTMSFTDVPASPLSLSHLPSLREAFEELGIGPDDVDYRSLRFLGVTRELIRGGEPEIFFVAASGLSASDFMEKRKHARDKHESRKLHFFDFGDSAFANLDEERKTERFRVVVDKCIDRLGDKMSIPLWTNLALWKKARVKLQWP